MNGENNIAPVNEELNVVEYETENIRNLIYTIRGKQVMLDSDVARLYHYETKKINQTVKRNIERFPEKFCFQLSESEMENLRSQFVTSSLENENYGGRRYLPYVFTEQGIAMLSGLLRNDIAIKVSINIMDAFVEMRKFILNNGQIFERLTTIEYKMLEHDKKFDEVFDELQRNKNEEFKQQVFFNGQIYDAYSLIIDIIKTAQKKILVIDNYIDDTILKMLTKKNKNVEVVILTSEKSNITKLDIQKFNKEYSSLKVAKTNKFHDRFMIIDNKELYHIGASLKDAGKKCFAISKIEDMEYLEKISKMD
ncbi:MAG: ORF6N domain-containing protein [Clostridia bacterium]|nr:ORF6N domain-containing protein [Clostridia bacterium]